jgi:hypothetical protein
MNLSSIFKRNLYSHRFVATLCATVLCPTLFFVQAQIRLPESSIVGGEPRVLSAPFFKFATMGYWPAAVDWMWIQTLQISGGKKFPSELIPYASGFYEMATDLDPSFYVLYEQAGVLFSFYFKSVDVSIHFLEKGIQNISASWTHPYTLHLLLAYLYSYEKNDWAKGKEYYLKASEVKGSPKYLQNMKVWLTEKDAEKKLASRVLTMLARQTDDERLKADYLERLKKL